jgi:hypothetical protein
MLRVHGNQWDEADFEPVAGLCRYDSGWNGKIRILTTCQNIRGNRTVIAPWADPWLLIPIWFNLRRTAN